MHRRAALGLTVCIVTSVAAPALARDEDQGKVDDGKKVTLCHRPPGNPANAHTISVGEPATAAHLRHGDQLGPCPDEGGVTSRTPATGDAPAKGRKDRTRAGSPRKAEPSPPPP